MALGLHMHTALPGFYVGPPVPASHGTAMAYTCTRPCLAFMWVFMLVKQALFLTEPLKLHLYKQVRFFFVFFLQNKYISNPA